jgi:hypothetical protein
MLAARVSAADARAAGAEADLSAAGDVGEWAGFDGGAVQPPLVPVSRRTPVP